MPCCPDITSERESLKTLSGYREPRRRGHVWWKTVLEVGAGNWKSPFADSGKVNVLGAKMSHAAAFCTDCMKTVNQVGRQPSQHTVAVVKSAENKRNDQRLGNSSYAADVAY